MLGSAASFLLPAVRIARAAEPVERKLAQPVVLSEQMLL